MNAKRRYYLWAFLLLLSRVKQNLWENKENNYGYDQILILEDNIDDDLWPELILAMTYIKNNQPTKAIQDLSPYKGYTHKIPNLSHLQILSSIVYVFLHKEEQMLKSEKWAPKALKEILLGYNGHTIYQIYPKDQKKVIQVKDLHIFQDYASKGSTALPDYRKKNPTIQCFLLVDNDDEKDGGEMHLTHASDQKALDIEIAEQPPLGEKMHLTCASGQKVLDAKIPK